MKTSLEIYSVFLDYFETQSDHFLDDLFVFISSFSLEYNEGGWKLSEFFVSMCTASRFSEFFKTYSHYNICFKYEANIIAV